MSFAGSATPDNLASEIADWDARFQATGKVVFAQKTSKMMVNIVLIFVAILIGLAIGAGSEGVDSAVMIAAAILLPIPVLILAWYLVWYRNTKIVIDTAGVTLTNRQVVPWREIIGASVWSFRGSTTVAIQVTAPFMREYQAREGWLARLVTKTNAFVLQGDALLLPDSITAEPEPLAEWISVLVDRHHGEDTSPVWYEHAVRG